jgi:C4-dicarboxylate-specific signal transduction histidine kinase
MAEEQATPHAGHGPGKTVPLNIEFLNFCGARFSEHAENYTAAAADLLTAIAKNMSLAAQICDRMASLRFEVAEIASKCTDLDAARELRDALDDAGKAV